VKLSPKYNRIYYKARAKIRETVHAIADSVRRSSPVAYLGTGISSPHFGGGKWPGGMNTRAPINIHDHYAIRQQVREKMTDSIECRALVNTIVDTVVDVGIYWKPTPIAEILGITDDQAEAWAENAAKRFHLWAQSKKSSRNRVNNFYQNTRLYELQKQRDNDVFTRLYYGRDKDQINPLQIEFFDPNQIRGHGYTSTYTPLLSDDGIIRDQNGREIGYKIWTRGADGAYVEQTIPAVGEKSGRIMMLHGYNPEYAGQGRGFSSLAHAIQELADLTDFKASVLQKAINQASFVGAVENDQQDASQPLAGRVAGPIREYGSVPTPSPDARNVTPESLEPVVNWAVAPEATIRQPGSMLVGNLRRGDKFKFLQDTAPSASFDAYVNSVFSYIAASKGWSVELVLKKFNANYSASRGTLLLCWRTAQIERQETVSDFCEPIVEMWLAEEIAAGRIMAPGWSDPLLRAAWMCCEWSAQPMPNIDPKSTMEADRGYVELGAQTLDDVARNLNGSSGKANRLKNARQYEELPTPPWPRAPITSESASDRDTDNT